MAAPRKLLFDLRRPTRRPPPGWPRARGRLHGRAHRGDRAGRGAAAPAARLPSPGLLLLFCGANTFGPFGDPDAFNGDEMVSLLLDGLLIRPAPNHGGAVTVLIRLLRAHLRPYRKTIVLVVLFQFVADAGHALPAHPERRHHRQRRGARATPATCCGSAACMLGVTAAADRRRRSPRSTSARARPWPSAATSRAAIFAQVQDFSAREVGQFGAPSLITRTTNDVQQVQMLVLMTFTLMVSAPIMCVGGIVLALRQDVPLSGAAAGDRAGPDRAWSPLIIGRMRPLFRAMQVRIDTVNRVMREQITGIRVIRAFVRDEREQARFGGPTTS